MSGKVREKRKILKVREKSRKLFDDYFNCLEVSEKSWNFLVSGKRQPWQGSLLLGLAFPCTRPDLLNRSNRPRCVQTIATMMLGNPDNRNRLDL